MSLHKNKEGMGWVVTCDCGEVLEILDVTNRADAARRLTEDKWRFVKVGSLIKHMCPQCTEGAEIDKNSARK